MLCDVLFGTGLAGIPGEYFSHFHMERLSRSWAASDLESYNRELKRRKTTSNGVFGFKLHYYQFKDAFAEGDLDAWFPNLHHLFMTRRDHLRQAISLARATQTGQWTSRDRRIARPNFNPRQITECLKDIEREESLWEEHFVRMHLNPFRVVYEDFLDAQGETVVSILSSMGVHVPDKIRLRPASVGRQSDQLTEEWLERYRRLDGS